MTIGVHPYDLEYGAGPEFFFNGIIDDIRIYNIALSDSDIEELYNIENKCLEQYQEGFEDGKQFCINNPSECGLVADTSFYTDLNKDGETGIEDLIYLMKIITGQITGGNSVK